MVLGDDAVQQADRRVGTLKETRCGAGDLRTPLSCAPLLPTGLAFSEKQCKQRWNNYSRHTATGEVVPCLLECSILACWMQH